MKNLFNFRRLFVTLVAIFAVVFSISVANAAQLAKTFKFPTEWGKLNSKINSEFARISWTWQVENDKLIVVKTAALVTEKGVITITDGLVEFTPMDITKINSELSSVLSLPLGNKWVAATLKIVKNGIPYWSYAGYDGISKATINGAEFPININKPFIASPQKGTKTDKYVISDKGVTVYIDGKIVFNGIY